MALATTPWLGLYERVLRHLAGSAGTRRAAGSAGDRQALALELARFADAHGTATAAALLQEAVGRTPAAALDRLGPPLFAGEAEALRDLGAAAPLDRWGAVWDKLARLPDRVDGLNLDRAQSLVHILSLFPTAAAGGDPSQTPRR